MVCVLCGFEFCAHHPPPTATNYLTKKKKLLTQIPRSPTYTGKFTSFRFELCICTTYASIICMYVRVYVCLYVKRTHTHTHAHITNSKGILLLSMCGGNIHIEASQRSRLQTLKTNQPKQQKSPSVPSCSYHKVMSHRPARGT